MTALPYAIFSVAFSDKNKSVQTSAFWGKKYFTNEKGIRILIIGQDSLCEDAMSIILYSHLFPANVKDVYELREYTGKSPSEKGFPFGSWKKVKTTLTEWGVDFDFLYMTDASKVYRNGSWEKFDTAKSKELLEAEIEFCNPDLIILLGAPALKLLDETKEYRSAVESGELIFVKERRCVVSPFFIGNGCTQPNFEERLQTATRLIKERLKK